MPNSFFLDVSFEPLNVRYVEVCKTILFYNYVGGGICCFLSFFCLIYTSQPRSNERNS